LNFYLNNLKSSTKEMKSISTIAVCGMLIALNAVLRQFTIIISDILQISFSFLTVSTAGMLFGPIVGSAMAGVSDIINYVVRPDGPFFPGFTLNALLTGFIYGMILYKKPVTILRTLTAKVIVMVLINFLLNPLWLSILYGKSFIVVLSARILKNLIMLPINTGMLYMVLKFVSKINSFGAKRLGH